MGFPLMDGLTSLLLTMMEAAKGYFGVITTQYSAQMKKICDDQEPTKNLIGFVYDEEEPTDEEVL